MKVAQNTVLIYIMLIIIQILISNYCQFTPYLLITLLPAMIFCLPLSIPAIPAMLIAFMFGLSVDWLSEGLLGLNALALVPVAALRKIVIQLFLGRDVIDRKDTISFRKNGVTKISAALLVLSAIFLAVYILADGAGLRPMWFNLSKFGISLFVCYLLSLLVVRSLIHDDKI